MCESYEASAPTTAICSVWYRALSWRIESRTRRNPLGARESSKMSFQITSKPVSSLLRLILRSFAAVVCCRAPLDCSIMQFSSRTSSLKRHFDEVEVSFTCKTQKTHKEGIKRCSSESALANWIIFCLLLLSNIQCWTPVYV